MIPILEKATIDAAVVITRSSEDVEIYAKKTVIAVHSYQEKPSLILTAK